MSDFLSNLLPFMKPEPLVVSLDTKARAGMMRMLNPPIDPELKDILDTIQAAHQIPNYTPSTLPLSQLVNTAPPSISTKIQQIALEQFPTKTANPTTFEMAKKSLLPEHTTTASALPLSGATTLIKTASKGFFTLIPFFLFAIISSKEKHLNNINVQILATPKQKIYQIGFGKKNSDELNIAFEVNAGQPLRFLQEREAAKRVEQFVPAIFSSTGSFSKIPGLNLLMWKKQETHNDCNIIIDDPGNPLLKDGPITQYLPLSKHEGFHIIHRDSTRVKDPLHDYTASDYVTNVENSNYASLNTVSIKVTDPISRSEKHRTQIFPLPFADDPVKFDDYYLRVTQYQ